MTDEELLTWRRFVEQKIKQHDEKIEGLGERISAQNTAEEISKAIEKHDARMRVRDIALGGLGVAVLGLIIRAITGA